MNLLILVVCLLIDRYLIHQHSLQRFSWFAQYYDYILQHIKATVWMRHPFLKILCFILPITLLTIIILGITNSGILTIFNGIIQFGLVYYCLGSSNIFYPAQEAQTDSLLVQANTLLFSVFFWFLVLGPAAMVAYRLTQLVAERQDTALKANQLLAIFNWIPARVTSLLYLLVGNFQKGIGIWLQYLFMLPGHEADILRKVGTIALQQGDAPIEHLQEQQLVEHAIILSIVLLAVWTILS